MPVLLTSATFWLRVERSPSGCWLWLGKVDSDGYGYLRPVASRSETIAHRYAYVLVKGPIPEGLQLDHLCRTRRCVNPDHLEPVTNRQNALRGLRAQQTHCRHGHPFTEANTYYWFRRGNPQRTCRTCNRLLARRKRVAA